jgi:ubiquitin carboxyl-terminal hydrolase L5
MDAATKKGRTVSKKKKDEDNDEGFHFIAYVPVNGVLWELDGLRRQPVKLGPAPHLVKGSLMVGDCKDGKWLALATPRIQERIERYPPPLARCGS